MTINLPLLYEIHEHAISDVTHRRTTNESATRGQIVALKRTPEFQEILATSQKMADQVELMWGYPEFYDFVKKAIQGQQIGSTRYNGVPSGVLTALGRLSKLHIDTFDHGDPSSWRNFKNDVWGPEYERGFFRGMTESEIRAFAELILD